MSRPSRSEPAPPVLPSGAAPSSGAVPGRPTALVLRALGLGDLLTAVPALRAVRRALPRHRLVLAAPAPLWPLATLTGAVDGHRPVADLRPFGFPPPDVAVNLHGSGPQSHRLLSRLRPGRLVAFGRDDIGVPGPAWRADEHEVARWCRLVGDTLGGDPDPGELGLPWPAAAPAVPGAVVVHPGAAYRSRCWPAERYATVAARMSQVADVVVTGSAAERPLADRVRRRAGLPPAALLAGRTTLLELAAQVAHARLVISGDTGVAHLATACGTPSVVLFGPTPPQWWGPPADGPHLVLWHGTGPGDPFANRPDPALLAISPAEVLEAAHHLLSPATTRSPGSAGLR